MADAFTKEAFTLLGVGIGLVALRTYARWSSVGIRNFMLDDYLMLVAVVVYALETGAAYSVGAIYKGLANNSMTDEYRRNLPPDSEEYKLRVGGSKLQLMGWSSYTLLLWLLKLCMCIFYTRLTVGLQHMRTRIRLGFIFIGVTYVITITAILAGCGAPFRKNWQIYPDPGNRCQPAISKYDLFFTVVLNVVTDLYLMSIPLPLFWKAQIPIKKKTWLLIMFSGGIFVVMAGILRCVLILTAGANGAQQAGSWAVRETFVAVVIGNIPMIQPLLTRSINHLSRSFPSLSSASTGNGTPLKDFVRISRKPRTANPLTISSSAEHIIEERSRKNNPDSKGGEKSGIHVAQETVVDYESLKASNKDAETIGHCHCSVSA